MLSNYSKSAIRTLAPLIAGWVISLGLVGRVLALVGADSTTAREWTTGALVAVLGWVYYLVVRALEQRWPQLGVLLGVPAQPTYDGATSTGGSAADADDWQGNGMGEDSPYVAAADPHAGGHDSDVAVDAGEAGLPLLVQVLTAAALLLGCVALVVYIANHH
jgi:hypothetical protein